MFGWFHRLEKIGFIWEVNVAIWEDYFAALVRFKEREGHCRVPTGHKVGHVKLASWVATQRSNKDTLSPERHQRLDKIGFDWDPLSTAWEEGFAALLSSASKSVRIIAPRVDKCHHVDSRNVDAFSQATRICDKAGLIINKTLKLGGPHTGTVLT